MFYHAYDNYLKYAKDFDELMPITCSGMNTWGTFSLSLIDALDTLVIMGNYSEFRRVAQHIINTATFETNTNVSVFETNIRGIILNLFNIFILNFQHIFLTRFNFSRWRLIIGSPFIYTSWSSH